MFENPRRGRQARNFTTNASKILHLKSSSEQIFSRKLPLGAPAQCLAVVELQSSQLSTAVARRLKPYTCIFFREHFLYNALKTFPVTQFRSSERRKLHFRESNFKNLPGGGGHAPGPAEPLHPVLPNATENPASDMPVSFFSLTITLTTFCPSNLIKHPRKKSSTLG